MIFVSVVHVTMVSAAVPRVVISYTCSVKRTSRSVSVPFSSRADVSQ